jgi:hypothetical protein
MKPLLKQLRFTSNKGFVKTISHFLPFSKTNFFFSNPLKYLLMKKILLLLAITAGLSLSSCYQEPKNGIAKITVVDANHFRVPSADVHLFGPPTSYIDVHGFTDMHGEYVYEHDPALIVQLNAVATFGSTSGQTLIRIEPDKTEEKTIVLY